MDSINNLLKAVKGLPWIVKIILCIPALDVVWTVYRILDGIANKKITQLVIGIIWILGAFSIGWILDIIWMVWKKEIFLESL